MLTDEIRRMGTRRSNEVAARRRARKRAEKDRWEALSADEKAREIARQASPELMQQAIELTRAGKDVPKGLLKVLEFGMGKPPQSKPVAPKTRRTDALRTIEPPDKVG